MMKNNRFFTGILVMALVFGIAVLGCDTGGGDDSGTKTGTGNGNGTDGIQWESEPSGTLTTLNNTSKDMIVFQGQTPNTSNILGGVRANSTRVFDISDDVDDFDVGGYIILRGISKEEYEKNKANLSAAKAEYSAMATYGQGKKFRTEINPAYSGEYYFKITNGGRIGMELRKNSPDGEKIGYLPALATNYALYSSSADDLTIFPVYVFYSNISKTVTTVRATSFAESASVGPRPVTDQSVQTVRLPNDPNIQWDQIVGNIVYPVAFITVTNNVANQSSRFASSSKVHFAQNGYDSINSGESLTFEISATEAGQQINLNCTLYGGTTTVAVKTAYGGTTTVAVKTAGNETPVIKNGYDYTVTLTYTGGGELTAPASYTAVITEGAKRNITDEITSL
ncbi:MAG: hypothetical protein LBP19_09550 [Treponema sp.]|jgi:hypothetical protein|nr:hypothetical protein [Treponema sp.]